MRAAMVGERAVVEGGGVKDERKGYCIYIKKSWAIGHALLLSLAKTCLWVVCL